jgi:hypothetical protein
VSRGVGSQANNQICEGSPQRRPQRTETPLACFILICLIARHQLDRASPLKQTCVGASVTFKVGFHRSICRRVGPHGHHKRSPLGITVMTDVIRVDQQSRSILRPESERPELILNVHPPRARVRASSGRAFSVRFVRLASETSSPRPIPT